MSKQPVTFMKEIFAIAGERLSAAAQRWHARRIEAHNLARLGARDLADIGMTPSEFAFRLQVEPERHEPIRHLQVNHLPRKHVA